MSIESDGQPQAGIKVESFKDEKVFQVADLHVDQLSVYDLSRGEEVRRSIAVLRRKQKFDDGGIDEFGTHGADLYFYGLKKVLGVKQNPQYLSTVGFAAGDEIVVTPGHLQDMREWIYASWRQQMRESEQYRGMHAAAQAKWKKLQLESPIPKEMPIVEKNAEYLRRIREAYGKLDDLISKGPIPPVIRRREEGSSLQ